MEQLSSITMLFGFVPLNGIRCGAETTAQICRTHLHQQSLQLCSNLKEWLLTLAQLLKSVFRMKEIESSWLEIRGVNVRIFEEHFYGHSQSHQQRETCHCYTSTLQLDTQPSGRQTSATQQTLAFS